MQGSLLGGGRHQLTESFASGKSHADPAGIPLLLLVVATASSCSSALLFTVLTGCSLDCAGRGWKRQEMMQGQLLAVPDATRGCAGRN